VLDRLGRTSAAVINLLSQIYNADVVLWLAKIIHLKQIVSFKDP